MQALSWAEDGERGAGPPRRGRYHTGYRFFQAPPTEHRTRGGFERAHFDAGFGREVFLRMNPRKPVGRAQGHRKRPALALVADVVVLGTHEPPADLLPEVRADWLAFWRTDFSQLINWDRDKRAFSRLFKLYSLRLRLEAAVAMDGVPQILVEGSQEQRILNPALRHMATVDGEILQLEQQFGLTPRSAAGLGLQIGGLKRTLDDLNRDANDRAYGRKPARKVKVAH